MKTSRTFVVLILASLLGACASTQPTRFYALSADSPVTSERTSASGRVIIGIGPVQVAPYLERGQIVTRSGRNQLNLAEFDQWAEPIETNISNVIAGNLEAQLPDIQTIVRPWPDADTEYTVVVKLSRFDTDGSGNVSLDADWGIQNERAQTMQIVRDTRIRQTGKGTAFPEIAATMSAALAGLSEEIATELTRILKP